MAVLATIWCGLYVYANYFYNDKQIDVEKHAEKESYAGVCDEVNLGVTLIFLYTECSGLSGRDKPASFQNTLWGNDCRTFHRGKNTLSRRGEKKKMMYQLSRKMTGTIS